MITNIINENSKNHPEAKVAFMQTKGTDFLFSWRRNEALETDAEVKHGNEGKGGEVRVGAG